MDEADLTAERLAREMDALLKRRAEAGPAPTGQCLWCGAPLDPPRRWCDADCLNDWERDHARRAR